MGARMQKRRRPIWTLASLWLLAALIWYLTRPADPHLLQPATPAPAAPLTTTTPLSLHGRVTKHGPVVGLSQLAMIFAARDNPDPQLAVRLYYPLEWRQQRLAGKQPEPPGRLCAIMWNDDLKIIYVKNVKTAGSTLLTYFKECAAMGPKDLPFKWRCLNTLNFGNATQVEHLMKVWDSYFVFAFGRNVLSRSVSQYTYLTRFMSKSCAPTWSQYCRDPYVLGDVCEAHEAKNDSCCDPVATSVHQYLHAMPQAPCMVTQHGRTAVDWVGRVEAFDQDFAQLLSLLNRRPGLRTLPPPGEEMVSTNVNRKCQPSGWKTGSSSSSKEDSSKQQERQRLADSEAGSCDMEYFSGRDAECYLGVLSSYSEDVQLLMS